MKRRVRGVDIERQGAGVYRFVGTVNACNVDVTICRVGSGQVWGSATKPDSSPQSLYAALRWYIGGSQEFTAYAMEALLHMELEAQEG